jgi:hypothetical protein
VAVATGIGENSEKQNCKSFPMKPDYPSQFAIFLQEPVNGTKESIDSFSNIRQN